MSCAKNTLTTAVVMNGCSEARYINKPHQSQDSVLGVFLEVVFYIRASGMIWWYHTLYITQLPKLRLWQKVMIDKSWKCWTSLAGFFINLTELQQQLQEISEVKKENTNFYRDSSYTLTSASMRRKKTYASNMYIFIHDWLIMMISIERSIGKRFKRSKKTIGLTDEDIDYLKHNTRYDEKEIREWYR